MIETMMRGHMRGAISRIKDRYPKRYLDIVDGSVTLQFLIDLIIDQEFCCALCGRDLRKHRALDHIKSLAYGGRHSTANLQFLCIHCNSKKWLHHVDQYTDAPWRRWRPLDPSIDDPAHCHPSFDFNRPSLVQ